MDKEAFSSILRGYYVAHFLELISKNADADLGPKFEVRAANGHQLAFPHPLLHPGRLRVIDEPAAIIESSIIATALCSAYGNLRPLDAYWRLRDLGGEPDELNSEVEDLIRASAEDNVALFERKKIGIEWFDAQLQKFDTELGQATAHKSVYEYPTVWEIQNEIRDALKTLRNLIGDIEGFEAETKGPVWGPGTSS
jgi:hypothetical protein